jgi:PAS domain S-box-containing protein
MERQFLVRRRLELKKMDNTTPLPVRARLLILGVVLGGAAFVGVRIPEIGQWNANDLLACIALIIGITITEQFPVPLRFQSETLIFSLTEAVWVGALMLARPSVLVISVAVGITAGQIVRRVSLYKMAFNVGQFLVALGVAQTIYASTQPPTALGPNAWLAAAVSMAAYAVVNATLVAKVISLVGHKPFLQVLIPPLGANAIHFIGNTAIGLEIAVIWAASPLYLPVLGAPLFLALLAYRALVRSVREGDRVRNLIVEHASDGIFVVASDGRILSWNPAMERITGHSSDEVIDRQREEILGPAGAYGPGGQGGDGASSSGRVRPPVKVVRKDGSIAWVNYSSNAINTRDGKVRADVIVVHDVTAIREAEQLKSDFVATISHELRTPLTPLKGFLSALLIGSVDDSAEARQEYYRIMLKQTDRLERLITDLLDVSRVESEEPLLQRHEVELGPCVMEQIRSFSDRHPDRIVRFHEEAGPVKVIADPAPVGLVISNLMSNAMKYSPSDTPVDVTVSTADGTAIVSVTDQGEGIPVEEQARIFDRFYQVEGHLTRSSGGIGLGLYISRRLVETMGGELWVESTPGLGATFSFSLPLSAPTQMSDRPVVRTWGGKGSPELVRTS